MKTKKLNPRQEMFCKFYASDREYFGNGVESYLEVYSTKKKPITYNSARANASILLTNPNILVRIDELMDIYINDQIVDKELAFVILQKAELPAKVAAIKEYNQLKNRVKSGQTINILNVFTDEQRRTIIRRSFNRLTGSKGTSN